MNALSNMNKIFNHNAVCSRNRTVCTNHTVIPYVKPWCPDKIVPIQSTDCGFMNIRPCPDTYPLNMGEITPARQMGIHTACIEGNLLVICKGNVIEIGMIHTKEQCMFLLDIIE